MDGPDHRLEERLRHGMRPGGLSPEQRRRHLDRINQQGAWEMDFVRRRSFAELGVVVAVLLLVAAAAIWQFGVLDDADNDSIAAEPTALANTGVAPTEAGIAARTSCAVTPFSESRPPDHPNQPVHAYWIEGDNLWVSPPDIDALNPALPETEYFWFTGVLPVIWNLPSSEIPEVSAQHLENPGASFSYEFQQPVYPEGAHSLLEFSEPGCWEVSAETAEGAITFTVDVQPFSDRPDVIAQFDRWQQDVPFGVPGSCRETPWEIDDPTGSLSAIFWMYGDGISARSQTGVLRAEWQNRVVWVEDMESTDISITGQLRENPAVELEIASSYTEVINDARIHNQLATWLVFPEPGCWTIQAESPNATEEFTVYVYPSGS